MASDASHQALGTELQALVQSVSALGGAPGRPIWLAPLPAAVTLGALAEAPSPGRALPVLGIVDLPRSQRQELLVWDHTGAGGNLGVAGAPRTGKSTLLVSLVLALTKSAGPTTSSSIASTSVAGGSAPSRASLTWERLWARRG